MITACEACAVLALSVARRANLRRRTVLSFPAAHTIALTLVGVPRVAAGALEGAEAELRGVPCRTFVLATAFHELQSIVCQVLTAFVLVSDAFALGLTVDGRGDV